jgi:hypothetical protein
LIVGDLSYLRSQLSERHLLSGILADIVERGCVIDAREVLPDAISPGTFAVVDPSVLQRFDSETFLAGVTTDMREAKSSVLIGSHALGERSAHVYATVLKPLIQRGVRVVVVTGDDAEGDGGQERRSVVEILRASGVVVRRSSAGLCNGVVVDDEIVWMGNTPPLRCVDIPELFMTRVVSRAGALSLVREIERECHESPLPQREVVNA